MRKSFIIYLCICCALLTACNNSNVKVSKNVKTEIMETIREDLANIPESSFAADLSTAEESESVITLSDNAYVIDDFASFKANMEFCEVKDDYYSSLMGEMSNNAVHVVEFAHLHNEYESLGEVEKLYDDAAECVGDTMILVQLVDVEKVSELEGFNIYVPLSDEELKYFVGQLKEKYENVSVETISNNSGTWHTIIADGISGEESSVEQLTVAAIGYLNDEKTIAAIQLTNINNEDTMISLDERRSFISQEVKTITDSFILN